MGAMSYVSGHRRPAAAGRDHRAASRPHRGALAGPAGAGRAPAGRALTWRELAERAEAFAAGLLALGLEPGDRVGIWSPNNAEWVITQFATAKAGLILVNINPAYRLHELEYALNKVGCRALVTATAFKTSDYAAMLQTLLPELAQCAPGALAAARAPMLRSVIQIGARTHPRRFAFAEVAARGGAAERGAAGRARGHAAVRRPDQHPVHLRHHRRAEGGDADAPQHPQQRLSSPPKAWRCTEQDRLCIPVPLYHCFGMVMGVLGCLTHGAAMVFPGEGFDALAVLQTVAEERCTALYGVPTMFIAEMDHPDFDKFDLSSLRTGIMAGSPCPIEVMRRAMERMNLRDITIAYGMTETSPVSFQTGAGRRRWSGASPPSGASIRIWRRR